MLPTPPKTTLGQAASLGIEGVTVVGTERSFFGRCISALDCREILAQGRHEFAGFYDVADTLERVQCNALLLLRAVLRMIRPAPESGGGRASMWSDLLHDCRRLCAALRDGKAYRRMAAPDRGVMDAWLLDPARW